MEFFIGAAFTAAIVYGAGSLGREGLTPVKLTLAGAAMAAMFSSLTQGLLAVNELELEQVLFWLTGSVQGRSLHLLLLMLPYAAVALIISFFLGQKINLLSMGEDVAKGLGQKTGLLKLVMAICIVLLAGSAVAIAGPISFIGIIIPHFARFVIGNDYRWILPFSAVLGAILLVTADIGARYIIMPQEVPVGVMTAIIGMPIFVYIARRGRLYETDSDVSLRQRKSHDGSRKKALFVFLILLILTAATLLISAGLGQRFISPWQVAKTLFGAGTTLDEMIVQSFRMPRILVALVAGICLAVAGAILQGLVRNPLASPDIIGITGGALWRLCFFSCSFQTAMIR